MPDTDGLAPICHVRIDGTELPPDAAGDLIDACVQEDLEAPGTFALRLINWDMVQLKVTWADDPLFAEGKQVEIEMGYLDHSQKLMVGEITGIEPEFSASEVPAVTVRGYDRRHRLLRGRKTRSFTQMKDSDIASQIAGDLGLTPKVEDTGVTLDYVLQHNQTDMEFLQERARRIRYEIAIDDRTLLFRPRQHAASEVLTLAHNGDLLEFYPRLTTMTQVGQVAVRGWSPKDKAKIVAQSGVGDESTAMGGQTAGPKTADSAFGQTRAEDVDRPVFSQAEADQMAKQWFNEIALAYITGEGVAVGRTDLRAGQVIAIEGLGRRFSGLYYVTSTTHSFSPRLGYRTAFTVRRNAT